MAAGQGFKTFTTGEVLTAGDVNGYLMQGVLVFASAAARDAAITSPQEGQFAFTKDTNGLWYYDGAAWVASGATGDIEGVTAGVGISGGGTSGTVTVTNSMATAIDAKGDLVVGTGADTFAKLTVGANNTVLTADSAEATGLKWATPAGGGGLTFISSTTIGTTVSSISLPNNTFTSTYNNYRVIFDCSQTTAFSSSGAITINFRYRDNGVDMTGAAYNYTGYESSSGTVAGINQAGVTSNKLGIALDATPNRFAAVIDLFGIYTTAQTMHTVNFTGMNGGTNMSGKLDGFEFNPTAYDSMTFFLSTGTMTNGRIRVYGYQNS